MRLECDEVCKRHGARHAGSACYVAAVVMMKTPAQARQDGSSQKGSLEPSAPGWAHSAPGAPGTKPILTEHLLLWSSPGPPC